MSENIKDNIEEEEEDVEIKVILVGEIFTGKTSLINSAIGLEFQEKLQSTNSNSILNKTMEIDGKAYTINLWDTIGQEKYRSLTQIFMKDSKIIIFVYDITNRKTFKELDFWFGTTKEVVNDDTVLGLVGNKSDLYLNEEVKEEEGKELADKYGYEFSLTSAKNPKTFCQFLEKLVRIYINQKDKVEEDPTNTSQRIKGEHHKVNKKKSCCS